MTTYYNIVYNNNFTFSKFRLENIDIIINKSHMPFCLTDNVFLFSQKEMISVQSPYLLFHRRHFVKHF